MTWTSTPPDQPGFYAVWWPGIGSPYIVEFVDDRNGQLYNVPADLYVGDYLPDTQWCRVELPPVPEEKTP